MCKVREFQYFYKMLEIIQRKAEPFGGSQQAPVHSNERRANAVGFTLISFSSQMFIFVPREASFPSVTNFPIL